MTTLNCHRIPERFEYVETLYFFESHPEVKKYVTILEEFTHHYTGTRLFRVRREYESYMTAGIPVVEYETVTEDALADMLAKRKTERDT